MNPIEHIRRAVFGFTQREFAEAIGVAQPTVSRWEKGVPIASSEMASIRDQAFARGISWDDRWFFEVPKPASFDGAANALPQNEADDGVTAAPRPVPSAAQPAQERAQ